MNKYEDSTQKLHSHNWSEDYKENYDSIFGIKYKLFYTDGSQTVKKFPSKKEAFDFINQEGDHLLDYIEL